MRVLLVDDDDNFRALLRALMPRWATVVAEARNGRDAITEAQHWTPNVILMDYQMPIMDGATAALAIRHFLPAARIVMVSGSDSAAKAASVAHIVHARKDSLDGDALAALIGSA